MKYTVLLYYLILVKLDQKKKSKYPIPNNELLYCPFAKLQLLRPQQEGTRLIVQTTVFY